MATSETIRAVERPDSFDILKDRFMALLCRLQTLDGVLGNGSLLPIELQPAAFCFNETVKEVVQFYEDLEVAGVWDAKKTEEVQS